METATVQTFPEVVADLFTFDGAPTYTGMSKWKQEANAYGREGIKRHDWVVSIKRADGKGSTMKLDYHTGEAHSANVWFGSRFQLLPGREISDHDKGFGVLPFVPEGEAPIVIPHGFTADIADGGSWVTVPRAPKLEDVIFSIFSDVQGYEQSPTFPEWCREYGYSDDSISALDTFQAVQREALNWYRSIPLSPVEIERLADAASDY